METRNLKPDMPLTTEMIQQIESTNQKFNELAEKFGVLNSELETAKAKVTQVSARLKIETETTERLRGQIQAYDDVIDKMITRLKD